MMLTEEEKRKKKMKKFILTLYTLLFCMFFCFCQQQPKRQKTPTGFEQPEIKPKEYWSFYKEPINLQDSDIVKKIHALDCY